MTETPKFTNQMIPMMTM